MARSYNHVVLVGNLGRDPELRSIPSGKSVCSFTIATSRRYKDQSGQYTDYTDWHKIEAWGAQAENAAKLLSKGKTVLIEGELRNNDYEKDGVKHYGYKVVCNNFVMMDNKPASSGNSENTTYADFDDDKDFVADSKNDDDDLPF
jgi:single-strand DNA-binding protein